MSGYIGTQPVPQATQTRDSFTATSGQTSFATGGYTPNFLDVYLNGVKLAAADYTATNGSDVILASGASVNDVVDIVAYGTFELADHYTRTASDARYVEVAGDTMTGALTTTGLTVDGIIRTINGTDIDMDGTASGQLKLDGNGYGGAIALNAQGMNVYTNSASRDIIFGTNETEVMRIDGAGLVGIGTATPADVLHVVTPSFGGITLECTGATADPTFKFLGDSGNYWSLQQDASQGDSFQFRYNNSEKVRITSGGDLTLSGGVYLGGTGSANKLEDYERGSFSFTINAVNGQTGAAISYQDNEYIVVGELVHLRGEINFSSVPANWVDGDYAYLDGLPFTAHTLGTGPSINGHAGTAWLYSSLGSNNQAIGGCHTNTAGTGVYMAFPNVVGSVTPSARLFFSMTYHRV